MTGVFITVYCCISGFFVRYGEVYVADICFSFFGFINTLHCKLISLLLGDTTVSVFICLFCVMNVWICT